MKGIGGHQRAYQGKTDEWLTPPEIIHSLGPFDLDPCSPKERPWNTATIHYTENGLEQNWFGKVWLNPPYGPETTKWLQKLSIHNNGIALTFARTETVMFHNFVWNHATAVLFLQGRLYFYSVNGKRANNNAGGPSVLIAYGNENANTLKNANIQGKFIALNKEISFN
jgi:hypothetical protein